MRPLVVETKVLEVVVPNKVMKALEMKITKIYFQRNLCLTPMSWRRLPMAIPPGPAPTTITWKPSGGDGGGLKVFRRRMRIQERTKAPDTTHKSITSRDFENMI